MQDVTDTLNESIVLARDILYNGGDHQQLLQEIEKLSAYWDREHNYLIHFVRHTQIDEITKSVARLIPLAVGEDYPELDAELNSIAWQIEHVNKSEKLLFSNLF